MASTNFEREKRIILETLWECDESIWTLRLVMERFGWESVDVRKLHSDLQYIRGLIETSEDEGVLHE